MKDKRISQSGITLIALIITIIVMLILVAVTVKISIDSGLFGHAKNATQSWADMEGKESNIGNKPVTIDGVTYNSMDEYVASLPQKTETPETPTKPDRTGLSVGDYVDYTPDKADNYMGLGTSTSEKAGSPSNLSVGIPQDKNLKWRILSINESGTVDIISDTPTATAVYLQGSIGYNNGVYLLNDLCASLYSNSTLGVKARSINLMDIENKLRLAICMCDNYSHTNLQYDKKEMCKQFDNLLKEINIEYITTTVNFANYPYTIFISSKIMEMDSAEQNRVALYLFNSINFKIKNNKRLDSKEQMF